jgi:hypothetical protein
LDVGVYFLEGCTKERRDLLAYRINQLKTKLLVEKLGYTGEINSTDMNAFIENKLLKHYGLTNAELLEKKQIPSHFSLLLTSDHGETVIKRSHSRQNTGTNANFTAMEIWNWHWIEYFNLRPELKTQHEFKKLDDPKVQMLRAKLMDETIKHSMARKNANPNHQANYQMNPRNHANPTHQGSHHRYHGNTAHADQTRQMPFHRSRWLYFFPEIPHQLEPQHGMTSRKFQRNIKAPPHSLAAVVDSTELTQQAKLQAEIDSLKRTVNELTLRSTMHLQ